MGGTQASWPSQVHIPTGTLISSAVFRAHGCDQKTHRHISTMINQHIRKRIGCLFFIEVANIHLTKAYNASTQLQCILNTYLLLTVVKRVQQTHCRKITYKLSNPTHKTCTYAADWHMAYEHHGNNTNSTRKIYIMSLNNREKTHKQNGIIPQHTHE